MAESSSASSEIVGVRFEQRGAVVWYRAGDAPATVRSWVVAERDGLQTVGQVVVGRGQCLGFPGDSGELPSLLREARAEEVPSLREAGGKRLLESLPRTAAPDAR